MNLVRVSVGLVLVSLFSFGSSNYQGEALSALKTSLKATADQLSDWYINHVTPCLWSHVQCDEQHNVIFLSLISMGFSGTLAPEIGVLQTLTHLSLQGNNITGKIPVEFGNLTNLVALSLEDNHLTGEIPTSFGNLTKLKVLSLSQNRLKGSVPNSISYLRELDDVQLASNSLSGVVPDHLFQVRRYNFTGNNLNCGSGFTHRCASIAFAPGKLQKWKIGVIFASIGVIGFLLSGGVLFLLCRSKHKGQPERFEDISGENDRIITYGQLNRFSWRELQLATDDFSEDNVLGKGGYGIVYKGVLGDKTEIAVKRMINNGSSGGEASFLSEVEMISVATHKNLLKLIGFCATPSERLLVYPFMKNGSVASRLRDIKPGEPLLDWQTRLQVALGTAYALEYLHEHCNPKIIHRDVKAANILLDEDFEAVVGDFGLAKLVNVNNSSVTTKVRGTMGHIAPEYLHTGKSSEKTDIFAYGIMLLELVTGQRALDFSFLDEQRDLLLLDIVKKLEREQKVDSIIDTNLNQLYDFQEVEMIIQIALICTQESPENRPMMSEVVKMLQEGEGLARRWQQWKQADKVPRQYYEKMYNTISWYESTHDLQADELSGGR